MRMILLYYNCTFALFIFRLHKLGVEAHAYAHYTSLLCFAYVMNDTVLEEVEEIKDLGVHYDTLLLFDKHVSEKIKKAYSMLGIIKRNFAYISRNCFVILYKSLVRSHLEYANSVWYPKEKQTLINWNGYRKGLQN